MKPGTRQSKAKSTKEHIRELSTMVSNLQMASRVMQMGMQQMGNSFQRIDADISNSMGVLNDLQYRTLAMIETGTFDKDALDKAAEVLKLTDYEKASDKEDETKGYTETDIVEEDSVVTLTSVCKDDESKSVFRTKFKLDDSGNPEAQEKLKGLGVGDKADLNIGGLKHEVEVLAIRTAPPAPEATEEPEVNVTVQPEVTTTQ